MDDLRAKHEPGEPRVQADCVRALLNRFIDRRDEDAVGVLAARARTSPRTVYRVLDTRAGANKDGNPFKLEDLSLDLADRLCMAADAMLSDCNDVIS